MARARLTANAVIGEENTPPFPGTVGNEDRPSRKREEYDTFTEQPGFMTQQSGAPWQDNPRDEIGFGIPKAAAMFATAHKATRLAIMFLGDKVAPTVIEAQARDFMRLGSGRIEAALKRFADSETIYAEDCEDEDTTEASVETAATPPVVSTETATEATAEVSAEMEATAAQAPATAPVAVPEAAAPVEATPAETTPAVAADETVAAEATPVAAEVVAPIQTVNTAVTQTAEADEEDTTEAAATPEASEASGSALDEALASADEEDTTDASATMAEDVLLDDIGDGTPLEIDLFSEPEVSTDITVEDEADLEALYDIDEPGELAASADTATPPKKAGVKTLGGQPSVPQTRVASEMDELVGLWKDAPDVSSVFGG